MSFFVFHPVKLFYAAFDGFNRVNSFIRFLTRKIFLYYGERKEITKVASQIYQKRKSPDSEGSFGFERAGEINFRTLPKVFKAKK